MKSTRTIISLFFLSFTSIIFAQNCNNLGFESGDFTNWDAWRGKAAGGFNTPTVLDFNLWFLPPDTTFAGIAGNGSQGLSASQHQITNASTPIDFWTGISPLSPTGGNYSIQLGNSQPGAGAEMVRQKFLVTTANASYIYQYAVVFEDPGHIGRPLFEIKIFDNNDSIIPCGEYLVRADQNLLGFASTQVQTATGNHYIIYKNWTDIAVDLSPYIGDSVTVQFATGDCNAGVHFGYAYVDGYCQVLELDVASQNCTDVLDLTAPSGYQSYAWNNGMNGQSITVTAIPGDSIKVTLTPFMGCPTVLTHYFDSISFPIANFLANDTCINFPIQFVDSSYTNIANWSWSFGDGNTASIQNPIHAYANSGTFNVELIVTNNAGCSDTIIKPITICSNNSVDFVFQSICKQTVFFTDNSVPLISNPITAWTWFFGDGISSLDQHPSHIYILDGIYPVSMIVTYADNTLDTVIKNVTVTPQPNANFTANNVCIGNAINYANTSTINAGNIINTDWSFGDGNTSTNQNPTNTYTAAGTYFTQLMITSTDGCKDTIIKPVVVYQLPQTTIILSPPSGCEPVEVNFNTTCTSNTDTVFFDSFEMTFDAAYNYNTTNTTNGNQYLMVVSGTFNVWGDPAKLLDAAFNVNYTANTIVPSNLFASAPYNLLRPSPDIYNAQNHLYIYSFTGDGNPINFNFTDLNYTDNIGSLHYDIYEIKPSCADFTYSWNFGNGVSLVADSALVTYSSAGTYTILLNLTNNATGCINAFTETVVAHPKPLSNFNFTIPCEGNPTSFTNMSPPNITNWTWDFGDNNSSNLQDPDNLYSTSGNYNVKLIVADINGCMDTISQTVKVNPLPIANFTADTVCANTVTTFTDITTTPVDTWNWNFGNNISSTTQHPSNGYPQGGNYYVYLQVTDTNGCFHDTTKLITVNHIPTVDFTSSQVCKGDSTYFVNNSAATNSIITNWNWNFGDGNSGTIQNPAHLYSSAGAYNTSLTVTSADGCIANINNNVLINGLPTANFSFTSPCEGNSTNFIDLSITNISSWYWNFGDNNTSNLQNPNNLYNSNGNYNIQLIVQDINGCMDTTTQPLNVLAIPDVNFDSLQNGCVPLSVNLMGSSNAGIASWSWNLGNGNSSSSQNPTLTYSNPGSYDISLTVTDSNGCINYISKVNYINVYPNPIADFTSLPDDVTEIDPTIYFTDLSQGASVWDWNLGDGTTTNGQHPEHTYAGSGVYLVSLYIENNYGCADRITKPVEIKPTASLYIPNAFTPGDGDNRNDVFKAVGRNMNEFQLLIYDRWGELIFEAHNIDQGWNGTYKGALLPNDIYVWKIKARDVLGEKYNLIGKVCLIK